MPCDEHVGLSFTPAPMPFAQPDWDDSDPWDNINERYAGEVIPPDWDADEASEDSVPPAAPSAVAVTDPLTDSDTPF